MKSLHLKPFVTGECFASKKVLSKYRDRLLPSIASKIAQRNSRGQTLVEFTLVFVLLLVIAWIPADFGLAFYTGQLALNASREGARIASADRILTPGSCILGGSCSSAPAGSPLKATADRLSSALLPGATITVSVIAANPPGSCTQMVRVRVDGNYNYFFYQLLTLMGFSTNPTNIVRQTDMRWEHQC
jgi:hypothetical protein